MEHGFYDDECEGLTAKEINAFYGFSENKEPQDSNEDPDQSDEEQGDHEESEADIELDEEGFGEILDLDHNFDMKVHLLMTWSMWIDFLLKWINNDIWHEAIPVPSVHCPFNHKELSLFEQGLKLLMDSDELPPSYGVTLAELGGDGFDEQEDINIGLQKKVVLIYLPRHIWKSWTEIWAQGLFAMNSILALAQS